MVARPDRFVIYDIDYPPFMANRAFDATQMSQYPGASAIVELAERLRELGFAPSYMFDVEQAPLGTPWRLSQVDCVFRKF